MVLKRTDSYLSDMSFASSLSTSSQDDSTPGSSTSTLTIPGPGALTGKAVKALGVATLKGFGRLIMARHWAAVVHAFPHTDEQAQRIRHIDEIYDDLLEFSRPEMYSHDVNTKAMGIILAQIGAGQTRHLIRALTRWRSVELYILLTGILTQLAHLWNPILRGIFSSPLSHSYQDALRWKHESPVVRLILFLSKVIRSSARACRVVLDVGYLDVLVSLNHYFSFEHVKNEAEHHLYIACNASLLDITGYEENRWFVAKHPIASIWPACATTKWNLFRFKIRREVFLLGPESEVAFVDHSPFIGISLVDLCSQPSISEIPSNELLQTLAFNITHDQALRVFLTRSSYRSKVSVLSRIFLCLCQSVKRDIISKHNTMLWRYQFSFSLYFIAAIAHSSPENKRVLLHAGAANYLVDALRVVMPDAYESAMEMIREHGFLGLLKFGSIPDQPMPPLLFHAITALLGEAI